MNSLEKSLLSALPEHLQDECKIREIARQNHTSFAEAVSTVWLRDAEQKEKNATNLRNDTLGNMIRSQKDPIIRLAQTFALTTKEAECIVNAQLNRLESATSDELYNAGCDYLSGKIINSARSQLRRETQARSKNTFSLDECMVGGSHEIIADNGDDVLAWLIAVETVAEREQELLGKGTTVNNIDIEQSALEKTPSDIAKALRVTLRRGQQIAKGMHTAATMRQKVAEGGAGQQELF